MVTLTNLGKVEFNFFTIDVEDSGDLAAGGLIVSPSSVSNDHIVTSLTSLLLSRVFSPHLKHKNLPFNIYQVYQNLFQSPLRCASIPLLIV